DAGDVRALSGPGAPHAASFNTGARVRERKQSGNRGDTQTIRPVERRGAGREDLRLPQTSRNSRRSGRFRVSGRYHSQQSPSRSNHERSTGKSSFRLFLSAGALVFFKRNKR